MIKLGFLIAATVLYTLQVIVLLWTGERAGAIILIGCVIANLGLIWSLL